MSRKKRTHLRGTRGQAFADQLILTKSDKSKRDSSTSCLFKIPPEPKYSGRRPRAQVRISEFVSEILRNYFSNTIFPKLRLAFDVILSGTLSSDSND